MKCYHFQYDYDKDIFNRECDKKHFEKMKTGHLQLPTSVSYPMCTLKSKYYRTNRYRCGYHYYRRN